MKVTKAQLKQIIKEELSKLNEATYYPGRAVGGFSDRDAVNEVSATIQQIQDLKDLLLDIQHPQCCSRNLN